MKLKVVVASVVIVLFIIFGSVSFLQSNVEYTDVSGAMQIPKSGFQTPMHGSLTHFGVGAQGGIDVVPIGYVSAGPLIGYHGDLFAFSLDENRLFLLRVRKLDGQMTRAEAKMHPDCVQPLRPSTPIAQRA